MSNPKKANGVLAWIVCVLLMLAASCERDERAEVECPSEASVEVVAVGPGNAANTRKTCRWADRETTTETDVRGDIVLRTSLRNGKPDGVQIKKDWLDDLRTESNYRDGLLHGHQRRFMRGELVGDCFYVEGARDGACWQIDLRHGTFVEHYDRGERTGFWFYALGTGEPGELRTTRIYGHDILLAFDGEPVPLPPASLEVFGEVVNRSSCPRSPSDACSELFDRYQLCEQELDRVLCQLRAMERYKTRRKASSPSRW